MASTKGDGGAGTSRKRSVRERPFDIGAFIAGALRAAYRKTPMYHAALAAAKTEYFIPAGNGNLVRRVHFKCACCGQFFKRTDIAVDHVIGCGTVKDDIAGYVKRLLCGPEGLQVLCSYTKAQRSEHGGVESCHRVKTRQEAEERARKRLGI